MRVTSIALVVAAALVATPQTSAGQNVVASPRRSETPEARRSPVTRVLQGTLKKIDADAKTIAVAMADGTETVFRFTDRTVVHGIPRAARATALEGKEGAHIIVHYADDAVRDAEGVGSRAARAAETDVRKAGEKTARAVVFIGSGTIQVAEGTIATVDRTAKTVGIDTARGTREVFRLGEDCTINTAHGVGRATTDSGRALKKGAKAVVYYTDRGGKKIVHAIDEVRHAS
jgi:hypothetical protein